MIDKSKFHFLIDRFKKFDSAKQPTYKFTVTALYDDPEQQPFTCALRERGAEKLEEVVSSAIKNLKPDSIRVEKFMDSKAQEPEETNILRITPNEGDKTPRVKPDRPAKEKERGIIEKIDEYLSKLDVVSSQQQAMSKEKEALYNHNVSLLGSVNENNLDKIRHEHQIAMLSFKHELEVKELERQIKEKDEEYLDITAQLTEAIEMLDEHNKRIEREGKLENSARDFTALAKGALSVAPGLMKIAGKYGLSGLASALMDDSHDQSTPSSTEGANQETDMVQDEKFSKIQQIIQFCNGLSDDDLSGFLLIVREFEKKPASMRDIIGLIQT